MANEFVIKNGYFSQGNSNVTGSVAITQNVTASKALFSSSNNNQLMVIGSGSFSWITGIYGSQGNLLTVTDTFSGSLFTITDVSGYQILDITSDYYTSHIEMIGTASLTGSLSVTQDLTVGQNLTASKALFSSSNGNQLTVMGSGSTVAQVYGSQGNLLVVNDTFSGSIFTVTDISGYPILDVTSDYYTGSVFLPMLQSQSQQYVVVYNSASGLLTYVSASAVGGGGSGTPGGLNKQIQFNGLGGFSGSSNFTFDSASNVLSLTGSAQITGSLIVSGGFIVHDPAIGYNLIDALNTILIDGNNTSSVDWGSRQLQTSVGALVVDWENKRLWDDNTPTPYRSLDWGSRIAYANDGTISFDWSIPYEITMTGDIIPAGPYVDNTSSYNLGSPTAAWNEIYVGNGSIYFVSGSVSASIGFNNGVIDFGNASLSLPTLTTSSQQYIITYNSESGQLFYTASSAVGGGTFNSTSSFLGNGLSSSFNINHGFNTLNLHITVYSASGTYETVYPDIRRVNANTASIVFANPPLTNEYIVYISQ
jgi:hypothetical protein